jgi:acyl-CoA thioester hydrolase
VTEYVDIHFDDLDLMGIVHNARYAVLVERAITAYWARKGYDFDGSRNLLAVAEFTINYRVPITRIGPVGVEFWIDRLGTSSAVYAYRVVSGDVVHADGKRVVVGLDPATRRPAPWPADTRAIAETLLKEPAHQG